MLKLMRQIIFASIAIVLAATQSVVAENSKSQPNPMLDEARALIEAKDFQVAMEILDAVIAENPNNVDALCMAGNAASQIGNLGDSAIYFASALEVDPNHSGVLANQGELYLILKRPLKAKANLERLREICGETCEDYVGLAKKIEAIEAAK